MHRCWNCKALNNGPSDEEPLSEEIKLRIVNFLRFRRGMAMDEALRTADELARYVEQNP